MRARLLPLHVMVLTLATAPDASGQFVQTGRPVASDGHSEDLFGWTVAVDGNTAVIGAMGADDADPTTPTCFSGAAYVFERQSAGWTQVQRLLASDMQCYLSFGNAVAISGDTLVVGAHGHDAAFPSHGGCDSGAAYVFERVGGVWIERQRLLPTPNTCQVEFGRSLAIDGDWIVVGAPQSATPAAYVFHRVAGTWVQDAQLVGSGTAPFDGFGLAVDVSGTTAVVGAWASPGFGTFGEGYVFVRGATSWVEQAILDVNIASVGLGGAVAISGDRIALGAISKTCCQGVVYVWRRQGATWNVEVSFVESSTTAEDKFGSAVALDRDTLVVGDYGATACDSGRVHVYTRTAAAWVHQTFTAAPPVCNENLAWSVAVSGDAILAGAHRAAGLASDSGASYAFDRQNPATTTCTGSVCPCGNDDLGAGCANSTGVGAELFAVGSTSIAADDLQLRATHLPPFANCLFVMGGAGAPGPMFDGLMCLTAPRWRLQPVQNAGPGATAAIAHPLATSGAALAPGTVVSFQCSYRDPIGPCGARANLTNALVVALTP